MKQRCDQEARPPGAPSEVTVRSTSRRPICAAYRNMTHVLEAALVEVAKLPADEQDALGTLLLDEIKSDQRWSASFAASQNTLSTLADDALAEFKAGKTQALNESL